MGRSLYTYEQFLNEIYHYEEVSAKQRLLTVCAIKAGASIEENESLKFFMNEGYTDELFSLASFVNEESYAEKFKALAQNAQEKIKEKGKTYADKLSKGTQIALKFGGKILAPLKSIIEKIGELLLKAWDAVKAATLSAIEKSKKEITEKVEHFLSNTTHKKDLIEELSNMKAVAVASVKWATGGILDSMQKSAEKAATTDESLYIASFESSFYLAAADVIEHDYTYEEIVEQLSLFENDHGGVHIPFISSILKKLSSIPPFSLVHGIEAKVNKATEKGLNSFSIIATKIAGAPGPYQFPEMASLVGIVVSHYVDEQLDINLEKIAELAEHLFEIAIPGFGIATRCMKYGSASLAVHGVVQKIITEKKDKE